jgi:hypothetical protein
MGFFSRGRNAKVEEEIKNALLLDGELHSTNIYWEAFEKFANEHGGKTDKHPDGGQDTAFEMVISNIEVHVTAVRDRLGGTTILTVETIEEWNHKLNKFREDLYGKKYASSISSDTVEYDEHIEYYENRQKKSITNLKNDKLHGKQAMYHENGQPILENNYKDDEQHGKQLSYVDGELFQEDNYKDGKKHGKQLTYLDGELSSEEIWKNGEFVDDKFYD